MLFLPFLCVGLLVFSVAAARRENALLPLLLRREPSAAAVAFVVGLILVQRVLAPTIYWRPGVWLAMVLAWAGAAFTFRLWRPAYAILAGFAMNLTAMAANGFAMPWPGLYDDFLHVRMTDATRLWWLCDIIPILDTQGTAIAAYSLGDTLLAFGVWYLALSILLHKRLTS